MSMAGGVMRMRPVEGGLPIPAHGEIKLDPSGDHLMFIGLKRPFKAGEHVPVTLTFARAGPTPAMLEVKAADNAMPGMNMGGR
jgi:copper(I)-binding protein